jgi:hypothetical protein
MALWKQALYIDDTRREGVMRQTHVLTTLAVFAVLGTVSHSQSLAEAGQGNAIKHLSGMMAKAASVSDEQQQGQKSSAQLDRSLESLIHKVGADGYSGGYSGMSGADMRSGGTYSQQGSVAGDQSRQPGEYKAGSSSNDGRYGSTPSNPSDNYFKKESSGSSPGSSGGPYGGSVYGGLPTTPSADPMIRDLSR